MTQSLRRGRASDANLATSMAGECFQGLPYGFSRFDLMRLVEDNGKEIGVRQAAIAHYRFLVIRWTQDRDWTEPGERPVVFQRADTTAGERTLSVARVRELEYQLNEAGLLTWTDKGNYHRGGTRNAEGRILFAHGVDLSPGAAMLPELLEIDARRRGELKERAGLRSRISKLKGYVRPRLSRAVEDGLDESDKAGWLDGSKLLSVRTNANTPLERLKEIAEKLGRLRDTLSEGVKANARPEENVDNRCGKARKACGRTRKPSDTSLENQRHINTTKDSQTDKSVTSTPPCGQSTACSGETDAPNGAKSSMEMVDGRKNEGGGAPGSEAETAREDRRAGGCRREPQNGAFTVKFEARPGGKGRRVREEAVGADCGHRGRANDGNETCSESPKPRAVGVERSQRASAARNAEVGHRGTPANGPGLPPSHLESGRLWKPDTGTRHLSPLNVVETAGPRMLAAVSRANRMAESDQPDWGDFEDAAKDLCPQLGIGSQVWWGAETVMGRRAAAVCVMLIERKMCPDAEDPVRCPAAYLRGMTARARDDKLHLHASVFGWGRVAA